MIDWKTNPIYENDVSTILCQRWIACYMLYDWNICHANMAYLNNKCVWTEQVCERLVETTLEGEALKNMLTGTFNQILLEDVEDFIQTHMRVWECDRLTVELQVAKVEAELYVKNSKEESK